MRAPTAPALLLIVLAFALPAAGQAHWEPTPPPRVSAVGLPWYESGDPIQFAGDLYYPTNATVYFDGNVMVPTGTFDGVTLYADTTLQAYSVVYVPVGDTLLRKYDRRRAGVLAGTTGNRAPSFPVEPEAAAGPPPPWVVPSVGQRGWPEPPPPTVGEEEGEQPPQPEIAYETVRRPEGNRGVWVLYKGHRYESAGEAVPLDPAAFQLIGEYYGFPVFGEKRGRASNLIFLPSRPGLLAPYRRVQ